MSMIETHSLCKLLDSENTGDIEYMELGLGLRHYMYVFQYDRYYTRHICAMTIIQNDAVLVTFAKLDILLNLTKLASVKGPTIVKQFLIYEITHTDLGSSKILFGNKHHITSIN